MDAKITDIAGAFIIEAGGSFLNGGGGEPGEFENVTTIKKFSDGAQSNKVFSRAMISAAAARRWLRNTMAAQTGWPASQIRALQKTHYDEQTGKGGNTNKVSTELNPVEFFEDDLMGFMRTISKEDAQMGMAIEETKAGEDEEEEDNEEEEENDKPKGKKQTTLRGLFRASPLSLSIGVGLRKVGWQGEDRNYVGLVEGSSVPYTTKFMNTALEFIFSLHHDRVGVFANIGDRKELADEFVKKYLANGTIIERPEEANETRFFSLEKIPESVTTTVTSTKKAKKPKERFNVIPKFGKVYELANPKIKIDRSAALLKSLSMLEGGSKQATFATDISPKILVLVGLNKCANPILNGLFDDKSKEDDNRDVVLKIDTLKEIIQNYSTENRICTPVLIGIRTGYIQNERAIRDLNNTSINGVKVIVTDPISAAKKMGDYLRGAEVPEMPKEIIGGPAPGVEEVQSEPGGAY